MTQSEDNITNSSGRRQQLIEIAYRHIAERGFEGLRVRDVAAEAGINNATLHYYFPTKEALIQGVVAYLNHEFATSQLPRPASPPPAIADLRLEFEDLRYRLHENPAMFIVLTELLVRSLRDPAIGAILGHLYANWHNHLVAIIKHGIIEGQFRANLDPAAAATFIIAQIKGVGLEAMGSTDQTLADELVAQLIAQVELWLTR